MKKGLLAALLFLVFAVFMVSDGLFTSKVGICSDSLYKMQPWQSLSRVIVDEEYNPALDYQAFFVYPWMKYTLEYMKDGKIPLWSNLAGGGTPFLGNLSCACFFPLSLLGLIVPQTVFWSLMGLIKLWIGAFLTYCLLRRYGLCFFSALTGGLAFGFSGYQICWLMHPNSSAALFLPALFLGAEYFLKRKNGLAIFVNAFLLCLLILSGSPETSFLVMMTWCFYMVYRIRRTSELFSQQGLKLLFYSALTGLIAAGLSAFQLWPFFEYLSHSYGLELRVNAMNDFMNGGPARLFTLFGLFIGILFPMLLASALGLLQRKNTIFIGVWAGLLGGLFLIVALRIGFWLGARPHMLMQVFPELFGAASGGCITSDEVSFASLNGGYAGVITAFLALYTFVAPGKRHPLNFFIMLLICSFGAAHSIPWIVHIVKALPVLGWVNNSCILCLTAFSIAVVAPFGLEDLIFRAAKIYTGRSAAVAGVFAAIVVMGVAISSSGWNFFQTGFNLFEEKVEDNKKIVILNPKNRSLQQGLSDLVIHGYTTADVNRVSASIDGFLVGEMRTTERKTRNDGHDGYPMEFKFHYSLNSLDEGSYKVTVSETETNLPGNEEAPTKVWANIRVVQQKYVTGKDLFIICLSAAAFLLLISRAVSPMIRSLVLIGVLVVDLSLFGYGYNKTSKTEDLYPSTDVTDFLHTQQKPFRIFAEGGIIHPNSQLPYGIEHLEWDDRLGIDVYCKVCNLIKFDHLNSSLLKAENFNLKHRLFDFMGVKYVLVHRDSESARLLKRIEKFKLVFKGSVWVFENRDAMDRAFVLNKWVRISDYSTDHIMSLDPCEWALLEIKAPFESQPENERDNADVVKFVDYQPEYIRLSVESKGKSILVLTDNYYPGWKAYVDGRETPIINAAATFRAVAIETKGNHEVEFIYDPVSFRGGIYIALGALIISILLILTPSLTHPMRRKTEEAPEYLIQQ